MKSKRKYIHYLLLALLSVFANTGNAQPDISQNKTSGIGDIIPNTTVSSLYHSPEASLSIEDLYKGGGLIINFWATWCAPCISELKLLNKILPEYENLKVLAVTYEDPETISRFLEKNRELNPQLLNIVYGDTLLNSLFPHNSVPHVIWIDKNGEVKVISGGQEISRQSIELFSIGRDFDFLEKAEETFDFTMPLSIPDSLIQYRSFFHGHRDKINTNGILVDTKNSVNKPSLKRFYGWNVTATQLFWHAYDQGARVNHYLLELITRDSTKFFYPEERDSTIFANSKYAFASGKLWPNDWKVFDVNWMRAKQHWASENLYSYELILPERQPDSLFYNRVISELEYNLKIESSIEYKERDCAVAYLNDVQKSRISQYVTDNDRDYWYIELRSVDGRIKLDIQSATIEDILSWIHSHSFGRGVGRKEPYVDQSKYKERLDVQIDLGEGDHWPSQEMVEKGLSETLGLSFHMEKRLYPVLVLRDNN